MTLKEAAAATANWPKNSGWYTVIHYVPSTGEYICSDRQDGDETIFKVPVIRVMQTDRHVSEDTIREYTEQALDCQRPRIRD